MSRIVDRGRVIEHKAATSPDRAEAADEAQELVSLSRRARVISHSIGLCTLTALLISTVIALLFLAAFVSCDASVVVAVLFIVAMIAFILALIGFLREVLVGQRQHPLSERRQAVMDAS